MSKVTELAEAEAAAVEEAERAALEEADQDAGPAEPPENLEPLEQPKPMSEQAQLRAFEAAMSDYETALRGLFGAEFDGMTPCAFCAGMGFSVTPEYATHPERERCDRCGGHGQLVTGSLRPGYEVIDCEACQGSGVRAKLPPTPEPVAGQPMVVYLDPATGLPVNPPAAPVAQPAGGPWAPGYQPQPTAGAPVPGT